MTNPFVSIIIPAYNAERFIVEAVDSCLNQIYDNFEVIVVDDKSTDGTVHAILEYRDTLEDEAKKDRLVLIMREKNGHTGAALNTGIEAMRGEWFKEMQADDILLPTALHDMMGYAQWQPNLQDTIFYANVYRIKENGEIKFRFGETNRNQWSDLEFKAYLMQSNIGNGISILIHKSALDKHGLFDTLTKHEDYEMRLRWCILQGCRMHLIDVFVASYREHPNQYTAQRSWQDLLDEDMRIKLEIISKMSDNDKKRIAHIILLKNFNIFESLDIPLNASLEEILAHPKVIFWTYPSLSVLASRACFSNKGESKHPQSQTPDRSSRHVGVTRHDCASHPKP